jgi:hypothetical protein
MGGASTLTVIQHVFECAGSQMMQATSSHFQREKRERKKESKSDSD